MQNKSGASRKQSHLQEKHASFVADASAMILIKNHKTVAESGGCFGSTVDGSGSSVDHLGGGEIFQLSVRGQCLFWPAALKLSVITCVQNSRSLHCNVPLV